MAAAILALAAAVVVVMVVVVLVAVVLVTAECLSGRNVLAGAGSRKTVGENEMENKCCISEMCE